jgi:hypothetical protein
VIHIATQHYRSARWIDVQLRYLERHTRSPYRVYAYLDGIHPRHYSRFHFALDGLSHLSRFAPATGQRLRLLRASDIVHRLRLRRASDIAEELNHLGRVMVERAEPEDTLVFLHGDTFPIAEWTGPVGEMLATRPLAAVRRDENLGEPYPHPCFTAITPALWAEVGDWAGGPEWINSAGITVTDVGARLWRALEDRDIEWHPIVRTNRTDLHPLWFGVYGDIVYHHGAAFRKPVSQVEVPAAPPKRHIHRLARFVVLERRARRSARLGDEVFEKLSRDPEFYRELV